MTLVLILSSQEAVAKGKQARKDIVDRYSPKIGGEPVVGHISRISKRVAEMQIKVLILMQSYRMSRCSRIKRWTLVVVTVFRLIVRTSLLFSHAI